MKKDVAVKIAKSLEVIVENLQEISTLLNSIEGCSCNHKEEIAEEPKEEVEIIEETSKDDEVDLEEMSFKELKEYAKKIGVKSTGDKKTILSRIEQALSEDEEEVIDVEVVEETPVKGRPAPKDQVEKLKEEGVIPSDEDDDTDEVEELEEEDELESQVLKAIEDLENEDLAEILTKIGVSPKGKRQALIEKILKAIESGKIDVDDLVPSDTEDEEDDDEEEVVEVEEVEDTKDDEEDDDEEGITLEELFSYNNVKNEDMTSDRKKAIKTFLKESEEEFEELDDKKLVKKYEKYINSVDDSFLEEDVDYEKEELYDFYTNLKMLRIDDEGDWVEEEGTPYELNGVSFCCGMPLLETEEGFECSVCGEEYEAD